MAPFRLVKRRGDGYELRLLGRQKTTLHESLDALRQLLIAENPASDPGVARLFPPAYPDDLLRNLDFERGAGNALLAERLAGLDEADTALDAARVTEEQLFTLMRALNDVRLVLGTRLELTEDTRRQDLPDDEARETYDLYMWLSFVFDQLVSAAEDTLDG
jgi:Domain of unknown function (DUF2017)